MDETIDSLDTRVSATILRHGMVPADAPVLAMVSGGADSVAMLHALAGFPELADRLAVLHVDHGLRGKASEEDADFVEALCARLGVPCAVERVDVAAIARSEGLNLEDAGRRERYRLADVHLDALCTSRGVAPGRGRVAVAHTRDDRIETFLMRLAQGAGATGLTSMRPVRDRVVRPLIDATREEIIGYLGGREQAWREDHTNADTDRLRSKIRHEFVPLFREVNPGFAESLIRTLEVLADEDDLLREMGDAFARDFVEYDAEEIAFDRDMMATLSRPMARRAVRAALLRVFPEASRLEFEHVEKLVDGLATDGFAHDLPGGLRVHDEYGRMVVSRTGGASPALAPCLLPVPGCCDLGETGMVRAEAVPPGLVGDDPLVAVIDADAIREGLRVAGPVDGERMRPLGMQGSKKVSDVLTDAKVPRRWRAATPVVRDGDRVVWVAGVRMSDEFKVTAGTTRAVRISWER